MERFSIEFKCLLRCNDQIKHFSKNIRSFWDCTKNGNDNLWNLSNKLNEHSRHEFDGRENKNRNIFLCLVVVIPTILYGYDKTLILPFWSQFCRRLWSKSFLILLNKFCLVINQNPSSLPKIKCQSYEKSLILSANLYFEKNNGKVLWKQRNKFFTVSKMFHFV